MTVTQSDFDALTAKVDALAEENVKLKTDVETAHTILGDWTKQIDIKDLPALLTPENEIPGSGQYPVILALREKGANAADQRKLIDGQKVDIATLAQQVAALSLKIEDTVVIDPDEDEEPPPDIQAIIAAVLAALNSTSPENTVHGTMVVNGDILVRGRIAVFYGEGAEAQGFQAVGPHQVQLYGDGAGVAILGNTDKKGRGGVSPNTVHSARVAVDGEGGVRMTLNPPASSVGFNDPNHGGSTIGFDSDGELSLLQDKVGQPAPGQHLRVHVAHDLKEVQICLGLAGWRLAVLTSNGLNQFEKRYLIPDVG